MLNQFNASLWGDEAFSAVLSQKSIPEIFNIIAHDTAPPLYNLIEHFWFIIFGNSEIAIRSLSFLFFIITTIFVYKIASYISNRNTAILAAILTFLNPFLFSYGFEGRMYSLLLMTVTASFYFLIRKRWIGYVIATALALYSHHFAIFAVFVQGLWMIKEFIWGKRKDAIRQFKSFVAIALLYVPWLIPLYNQTKMVSTGFWLGRPNLIDFRNLTYKYLAQGIDNPLNQIALYIVLAILILRKWGKNFTKSIFLVAWFLIPIISVWLISQKFTPVFYERYLLYTIPGIVIIIASGKRQLSQILIGILIVIFAFIDFGYFTHPTKRPFRELASYVLEHKRGDDYLINWVGNAHHLWESKYYKIGSPLYLPDNQNLPYFVGTALMEKDDIINSIPKKAFRVGVITSDSIDSIKIPNYTKSEVHEFGNLKFIWFTK